MLAAKPPSNWVRALDSLFMLGILGQSAETGGNQTFLLMKLDSFDNAYSGMLDWERDIDTDLLPLFRTPDASSTPATWVDVTIKNKDARALHDASGKTELIYSFYNQNLLIITGNENALRAILNELDTQSLSR